MGISREKPGPGQESVWDYPRPPRVENYPGVVVLEFGGQEIARTQRAMRVLETSHPPVFYVPQADFAPGTLHRVDGTTWCEFKGAATYYDVVAVYPGRMDRCLVDNEVVQAQPGDFYGGWITSKVVGPFKGAPGTWGW